ncbi:MAG: DUF3667 domain-containing protein [Bacteroidetes bacterium]|nr:DUF3667 domain-containing protein [Bacteroidota bacterium]
MLSEKPDSTKYSKRLFLKSFLNEAFSIEGGVFRSLWILISKPGHLTETFFNSAKYKYIHPLRLYFVINLIFFFLAPILNTQQFQVMNLKLENMSKSSTLVTKIVEYESKNLEISEDVYYVLFNTNYKYNQPALIFFIIPLFALPVFIIQYSKKRKFIEHLYFSVNTVSFFLLLMFLIVGSFRVLSFLLGLLALSNEFIGIMLFTLIFVLLFIHLLLSFRKFYKSSWINSGIKSFILFITFFITLGLFSIFMTLYTMISLKLGY